MAKIGFYIGGGGGIYVSKSNRLAYSWKKIYVSNLQEVFTETRLEDVDFTQLHKLHKLRSLRRFLHFHFISPVHIWFISYIINTHFFHGNIWTHNWPAPNVSGFIAQLVEHRTGKSRGHGFKPRWTPEFFFQASLRNCINSFTAMIISPFSFHFRSSYMIYFIYH